jgi:hypothetical protein
MHACGCVTWYAVHLLGLLLLPPQALASCSKLTWLALTGNKIKIPVCQCPPVPSYVCNLHCDGVLHARQSVVPWSIRMLDVTHDWLFLTVFAPRM